MFRDKPIRRFFKDILPPESVEEDLQRNQLKLATVRAQYEQREKMYQQDNNLTPAEREHLVKLAGEIARHEERVRQLKEVVNKVPPASEPN